MQDANLDVAKEVAAAEDFIAKGVDVLIITPVNEEGVVPLLRQAKDANIPVVLEGNPVKGMTTMVAICDYDTGYHAGVEAGKYAKEKLGGDRQGDECRPAAAVGHRAALAGLHGRSEDRSSPTPTWSTTSTAAAIPTARWKSRPPRSPRTPTSTSSTASTTPRRWAACRPGRRRASRRTTCLSVGTGGEGLAFINAMENEPSYQIEAAMFPEKDGFTAIDAAVKLFNNEEVPEHIVSPTAPMIGEDWKKYYDYDGKTRTIKWDAVNALQPPAKCMKTAADLKK